LGCLVGAGYQNFSVVLGIGQHEVRTAKGKRCIDPELHGACLNLPHRLCSSGGEALVCIRIRGFGWDQTILDTILVLINSNSCADFVIGWRHAGWARCDDLFVKVFETPGCRYILLCIAKVDAKTEEPEVNPGISTKCIGTPDREIGSKVDRDMNVDKQDIYSRQHHCNCQGQKTHQYRIPLRPTPTPEL
jgi:hypothetical protein